jgi:beta-galactosidase/beta-glucuronidase
LKCPRPEFPRPDFERKDWINLNGEWQFEIDSRRIGLELGWCNGKDFSRKILVPFPPESVLSGIDVQDFMETVWYRRFFNIPDHWFKGRILLHFGAVDYEANVWINNHNIGLHKGGYTPFSFDITDFVNRKANEIVVLAKDKCRSNLQPTGKQSHERNPGRFSGTYTRVTGIWQTVWIESVPQTYIKSFFLTTKPKTGEIFIHADVKNPSDQYKISVTIYDKKKEILQDETFFSGSKALLSVTIPSAKLWLPENPHLYEMKMSLLTREGDEDNLYSYVGLREIRIEGNKILINNKRCFLRFVLDQGFYPDGIYTAPSDIGLKRDIQLSKDMGFNGARLHQKVFEPRFLYWADKLGYLVSGEFADWGADLRKSKARDALFTEWLETIRRDFNHPSIIMWTPLNENAADPKLKKRLVSITKLFDQTRPVIDSSGTVPHVESDIYDIHDYEQNGKKFESHFKNLVFPKDYSGQPFFVSEYGGPLSVAASDGKVYWQHGTQLKPFNGLIKSFKIMTESMLSNSSVSGFCYTQLYDIEKEINGFHDYHRRPKIDPDIIKKTIQQKSSIEEF